MNLKKAFDTVEIPHALEALREHKIYENYIRVTEDLKKNNVTKIKTQQQNSIICKYQWRKRNQWSYLKKNQ